MPPEVSKALVSHRTVVLFFGQPGADDAATARPRFAPREGTKGVSVFSAPIAKLASYGGVIAGMGVSPGARGGHRGARAARPDLIEGFIDAETLKQQVSGSRTMSEGPRALSRATRRRPPRPSSLTSTAPA